MKESCKKLEVSGIIPALTGMRLPTKSTGDSSYCYESVDLSGAYLGYKDTMLSSKLISKGNVHGKFQRGIIAWLDINMPRYIWSELDTYTVGVSPTSSESTMYTLIKECADITDDMFIDTMPTMAIESFKDIVSNLETEYGGRKNIPIGVLKSCLPEGWMQRRIKSFSYQALKGMYNDRKNHRLEEWKTICRTIESLPYFKELLIGECNE